MLTSPSRLLFRAGLSAAVALLAAGPGLSFPVTVFRRQRPPRPKPVYVYLHENAVEHRLWGFKRETTGQLTPLRKFPKTISAPGFTCGGPCGTAAYSPKRKMVFVTTANGVVVYRFAAKSGALKEVRGGPFGKARVIGLATAEVGRNAFLYGSDEANDRIFAWQIPANGKLKPVPGSPFAAGDHPVTLATAPGFLVAANTEGQSLSTFRIGTNGALTPAPGTPFSTPGATLPFGLLAEPAGQHVYAANCLGSPEVYGFSVNSTNAALSSHAPAATPVGLVDTCAGLAFAGTDLLYAFQQDGSGVRDIQALRRSNSGLSLVGSPQSSGIGVDIACGDPTGGFLFTARSQFGQSLRSFGVDPVSGRLTLLDAETPTWSGVDGLVVAQ